jgi:hypothetical protein
VNVVAILLLNVAFATAGLAVLYGLRRIESPLDALWEAGLALMIGLGASTLLVSLLLVVGAPFGAPLVAFVLGAIVLGGLGLRALPFAASSDAAAPDAPSRGLRTAGLAVAAFTTGYIALLVYLSPQLGIWEPDAWTFWTPKALAIEHYGSLHEPTFTSLPGPTYPLVLPVLEAMDVLVMGGFDPLALHLQFSLLLVGFTGALLALLRSSVPTWLVWPVLALMVVAPEFNYRVLSPLADYPLDYFFALAGVCLALWLERRRPAHLVIAGVFLATAMSLKREGLLLAGALVVGAGVASLRDFRRAWPPLALTAAAAFATTLPWRAWWMSHDLTGEAPATGPAEWVDSASRVWPSFELLAGRLYSWDTWLLLGPVVLGAAVAAIALARGRDAGVLYVVTLAVGLAAFTWIFVAVPDLPTSPRGEQPAPRAMASLAFLSIALAPLLLARLWAPVRRAPRTRL